jgi:hypothetical protein
MARLYQDHFLPIIAGDAGNDGDASYYRNNDTLSQVAGQRWTECQIARASSVCVLHFLLAIQTLPCRAAQYATTHCLESRRAEDASRASPERTPRMQ